MALTTLALTTVALSTTAITSTILVTTITTMSTTSKSEQTEPATTTGGLLCDYQNRLDKFCGQKKTIASDEKEISTRMTMLSSFAFSIEEFNEIYA